LRKTVRHFRLVKRIGSLSWWVVSMLGVAQARTIRRSLVVVVSAPLCNEPLPVDWWSLCKTDIMCVVYDEGERDGEGESFDAVSK
jgi:hypothetical protein